MAKDIFNEDDEAEILRRLSGKEEGKEKNTPEYKFQKDFVKAVKDQGNVNLIRSIYQMQQKKKRRRKIGIISFLGLFLISGSIFIYQFFLGPTTIINPNLPPITNLPPKDSVVSPIISTITKTIYQGGEFEGHSISGTYRDTFTTINDRDSIRILELVVIPISIPSTNNKTPEKPQEIVPTINYNTNIEKIYASIHSDDPEFSKLLAFNKGEENPNIPLFDKTIDSIKYFIRKGEHQKAIDFIQLTNKSQFQFQENIILAKAYGELSLHMQNCNPQFLQSVIYQYQSSHSSNLDFLLLKYYLGGIHLKCSQVTNTEENLRIAFQYYSDYEKQTQGFTSKSQKLISNNILEQLTEIIEKF